MANDEEVENLVSGHAGEAGPIVNSMLPFSLYWPSDNAKYSRIELNSAYRSDGSVMLWGLNEIAPDPNENYVPFIREDRVWEYVHNYTWYYGGGEFFKVKFDGTEKVGDRIYHRLKVFDHLEKPWYEGSVIDYSVDDGSKFSDCLIREEAGKVYALFNLEKDSYNRYGSVTDTYRSVYGIDDSANENRVEVLLYDFRKPANDYFWGLCGYHEGTYDNYMLKFDTSEMDYVDIENQKCKKLRIGSDWLSYNVSERSIYGVCYDNYWLDGYIVEGIGLDGWGSMTFRTTMITTNDDPAVSLNNVYDLNGNIIYKGVNWSTSGLDTVSVQNTGPFRIEDSKIEINADNCFASLIDVNGNTVRTAASGNKSISAQGLPEGIYILHLQSDSDSKSYKLHIHGSFI